MKESNYSNCKKVDNDDSLEQFEIQESVPGFGHRHKQCLILFMCLTTAYSMRACMGVAVVAMTDPPSTTSSATSTNSTFIDRWLDKLMLTPPYPQFKWLKPVQDTILASFFWGYMLLQIPAGHFAHKYGARYLIFGAMMINSLISTCLPWAALYGGHISVIICRILQGLSQACLFPSMHTFFGKWAPLQERGRLTALVYGGQAFGTVLGLPLTGFIAASRLGWPGIFRFYGFLSFCVGLIWFKFGADSPATHPRISAFERNYIERGIGQTGYDTKEKIPVPWRSILTSKGMWAIVLAHIGQTWGQLILYSEIPSFMSKVMKVNIKAVSCWPPAFFLVMLALVPKNIYVVETLLVITCAMKISSHLGFQLNHIDISPNFAGTMMSVSNFASNGVSSLAPITAGYILTKDDDEHLWRYVFYIAAGFYFFSNLAYLYLGTARRAPWDTPSQRHGKNADAEATNPMMN
ncbi:Putative inorganic phosphate cotransporter [Eumeta japonica]|uniref:Inorganic phosphate cotransporter n=1 Tax=Eumeta variegata TaxID=151549 RepID=A0A4C1Z3Z3_EUMVA|nr:Putative inorganic phosphate cotransporter [Eumeta japonica]